MQKISLFLFLFYASQAVADEKIKNVSFCEMAASGNDWVIDVGQKHPFLRPFSFVTSRALSVTLFPACTACDIALLTAKQANETRHILLDRDPEEREQHLEKFKHNREAFKSAGLGLITAPAGIISPDIVTHHFIPENIQTFEIRPYGKLYSAKAHIAYPHSIEDVQAVVIEANRAGKSVSILGRTMSQGKQAISNDDWNVAIDTACLNHVIIDPVMKIAFVGAGASWMDLQNEANQYGLAVRVMQASNIFSIGGSISANCHGWDHKTGPLRNTILSMKVVDADGRIIHVTPNDPIFDYIVGGYGGFGVIVEAAISLTDNVELHEYGTEVLPAEYISYFDQHVRGNAAIEMHLYRLSLEPKQLFRTGIAVNYQRVGDTPVVANLVDEPKRGSRLDRIKLHTVRRLPWLRKFAWNKEKESALADKLSTRNEIMRPPINTVLNESKVDTEWLQEYFVKGEDLNDFLRFLGSTLQENNVALLNASVRYVKQDKQTKLSYALEGDRFAIVLFFNQKLSPKEIQKTKKWVRSVIDYLVAHEGCYYLPYQHFATTEQFKACYPNWELIYTKRQATDPDGVFDNGLYADYLNMDGVDALNRISLFRDVFNRVDGQREGIRDFLNNVFMQLNDDRFFDLVDTILEDPNLNDDQIYRKLYRKIGQAKPNMVSGLRSTLHSLKRLKEDLGDQTAELAGRREIKGYVEIGYPGRMIRSLKSRLDMHGPFYAITEKESLSDYVEAGIPRPYDHFIPLNDYEPIPESSVPSASVDLVCMYIGLHHAPKDKLEPFLASIRRILRPNGMFILMDHDAHSTELQKLVNVVHSIFNAATGVKPKINRLEVRDFHSLQYWIDQVEGSGFTLLPHEPLVRKGDSTLNSLVRFDRIPDEGQIYSEPSLEHNFHRLQMQTYLTAPEWQNVRASQRYAEFLEREPAYRFPYFGEIAGFWNVYGNAWKAAQRENGLSAVAFSEYNLMNLFVGTSMTLEYGVKGIIAAPLAITDKIFGGNPSSPKTSPSDQERLRSIKSYGHFIENTPFYEYPYFHDIGSYWSTYCRRNHSLGSRLKGLLVGTGMTIEYSLKGLISAPMSYIYGSEGIKEDETIHLLIHDPDNIVEQANPTIAVLEAYPESGIKHIEMPRYMHFTKAMVDLSNRTNISCIDIAGHNVIQVDVKCPYAAIQDTSGARFLYDIPSPTDFENRLMALEVNVTELCQLIRKLTNQRIEVLFIHDY